MKRAASKLVARRKAVSYQFDETAGSVKDVSMKTTAIQLVLNRWPYGLELQPSANGLLLRPRQKACADWAKSFRHSRPSADDLADTRQLPNEFDAKEWQW